MTLSHFSVLGSSDSESEELWSRILYIQSGANHKKTSWFSALKYFALVNVETCVVSYRLVPNLPLFVIMAFRMGEESASM